MPPSNRELEQEREQEREWEAGLVGWWCQGADDKACDSILHTLMNPSSLLNVTSSNPQRLVILCEWRQQTRRTALLHPVSCILIRHTEFWIGCPGSNGSPVTLCLTVVVASFFPHLHGACMQIYAGRKRDTSNTYRQTVMHSHWLPAIVTFAPLISGHWNRWSSNNDGYIRRSANISFQILGNYNAYVSIPNYFSDEYYKTFHYMINIIEAQLSGSVPFPVIWMLCCSLIAYVTAFFQVQSSNCLTQRSQSVLTKWPPCRAPSPQIRSPRPWSHARTLFGT